MELQKIATNRGMNEQTAKISGFFVTKNVFSKTLLGRHNMADQNKKSWLMYMKLVTRKFYGSLIKNSISKLKDSKTRF